MEVNKKSIQIDERFLNYNGVMLESPEQLRPTDFQFCGNISIIQNITIDDMNWNSFFSRGRWQLGIYFDSLACVSFSFVRIIEAIFNYHLQNNNFSTAAVAWLKEKGYIKQDNKIYFSPRHLAKVSGTTKKGNSGYKVADAARNFGLVPENSWSFPDDQADPIFEWDNFYCDIPQNVLDLGLEFKEIFKIWYEFFYTDEATTKKAMEHSPVQLYVEAWPLPIEGIYYNTGRGFNHAVAGDRPQWFIEDSYEEQHQRYGQDFERQLDPGYQFYQIGYKYAVTETDKLTNNDKKMIIKKQGDPALYAPVGDMLIPFATDFETYQKDFGSAKIVELSAAEFNKLTIATAISIKKK